MVLSRKTLPKKILTGVISVFIGFVNFLIAAIIYITPGYDSFEENYYPDYYVVADRDNTVRLLFAEGVFLSDACTKVYYLDGDNKAYYMGQFSADDGVTQCGEYDIVREGDKISFSYNYGTVDKNNNPVYHDVTLTLPKE